MVYNKIQRSISIDPEVWYAIKENSDNISGLTEQLYTDWLGLLKDKKKGKKEMEIALARNKLRIKKLEEELSKTKESPNLFRKFGTE